MAALAAIARRHGIALVEDCSQAHGSTWDGARVGSIGDVGVFSMNQEKLLTSGEGGAAVTSDPVLHRRMEMLRSDGTLLEPGSAPVGRYEASEPAELMGTNLCPSEIQCALLLAGLAELDELNAVREARGEELARRLRERPGLDPLPRDPRVGRRAFFEFAVRCGPEAFAGRPIETVCEALSAELGLHVHGVDPPLHRNPNYLPQSKRRHRLGADYERRVAAAAVATPNAEEAARTVCVFHHRALMGDPSDVDDLEAAFAKVQERAEELPARP
jgi:dTDP-4-amino-4,6-dideoxygalactose transaminase